jgi:hypothetical protein
MSLERAFSILQEPFVARAGADLAIVLEHAGDDLHANVCEVVADAVHDAAFKAQRAVLKAIAKAREEGVGADPDDIEEAVHDAAKGTEWDALEAISRAFEEHDWLVDYETRRARGAKS